MNVFNYTQLKLIFTSLTYMHVKINQMSARRNSDSLRKEFTPKVRRIKCT